MADNKSFPARHAEGTEAKKLKLVVEDEMVQHVTKSSHSSVQQLKPSDAVEADNVATSSHVTGVSERSSGFEKESALASEFRHGIQFVISRVFHYLRLSKITKGMKDIKDPEGMKTAHKDMMMKLENFITNLVSEKMEETQIIQKLNELSLLIENQPLTFEEVWRPSGDVEQDLEDHLEPVHKKMEAHLKGTLLKLKEENRDKLSEIKRLEAQILATKTKMQATTDSLKKRAADELSAYEARRAMPQT